jgi:hypothetical protein
MESSHHAIVGRRYWLIPWVPFPVAKSKKGLVTCFQSHKTLDLVLGVSERPELPSFVWADGQAIDKKGEGYVVIRKVKRPIKFAA